jgi:hypothetical protein
VKSSRPSVEERYLNGAYTIGAIPRLDTFASGSDGARFSMPRGWQEEGRRGGRVAGWRGGGEAGRRRSKRTDEARQSPGPSG